MAYLHLSITDFNSSFGVGDTMREGWRAQWTAELAWLESVKLWNGSNLAKMDGNLNLKCGDVETGPGKAVGALSYFAASEGSGDGVAEAQPEAYYVEVTLPERELLRLMELEREGHGATGVSVNVPGLQYGYSPDGSEKEWPVSPAGYHRLDVEGLKFSFTKPVDEAAEEPNEDLPVESGPTPEVQAIRDVHRALEKALVWICGLLAAILVAVLLKR